MTKFAIQPDGCWQWTAAMTSNGYGKIGRGGAGRGSVYAHRVAYELFVGEIPKGLVIDHLCRNRACVNPQHLEAVTHAENLHRGDGWSGKHFRATHCPAGHSLSGENLYLRPNRPGRDCRTCRRFAKRASAARMRARKVA